MGMNNSGSPNQAVSGINVTPLIDVLLVLLIIFMVIVPVSPHGLDALVPQPPKDETYTPPPATIVVQVLGDAAAPTYKINDQPIQRASIEAKLAEIFATRIEKVMFVQGDGTVDYAKIADVIDLAHQAGAENIGLITPRLLSH